MHTIDAYNLRVELKRKGEQMLRRTLYGLCVLAFLCGSLALPVSVNVSQGLDISIASADAQEKKAKDKKKAKKDKGLSQLISPYGV